MKTYRVIALVAALLITVCIARFLTDKTVLTSQDQKQTAAETP